MSNRSSFTAASLGLLIAVGTCAAQTPEIAKFYRLDYVVKELDGGKTVNARKFTTIVPAGKPHGTTAGIRSGSKVPVATSSNGGGFNYNDIGVNIDSSGIEETGENLAWQISAEVSSFFKEPTSSVPPVVRQNRWNSVVIVPAKKQTVLFSSDEASSTRSVQLEVTASPIR